MLEYGGGLKIRRTKKIRTVFYNGPCTIVTCTYISCIIDRDLKFDVYYLLPWDEKSVRALGVPPLYHVVFIDNSYKYWQPFL